MNGQLSIESTVGVGSRFCVDLPLPAHTPAPKWPLLKGKVLVGTNANSGLLEMLTRLLPEWGVTCQHLADSATPDADADLLITDCPECLVTIREACTVPVLLVTAYGNFMPGEQVAALAPLQQQARPLSRNVLHQSLGRTLDTDGQAATSHEQGKPLPTHRARILLVEDNPVNQLVAKGMLAKLGCDVVVSSNGAEALQQLGQDHFDLVLMDCNMPVMNGYDATRRIRESGRWSDLPIIALTANAMPEEREHCKAAGMSDYLAKPFRREELVALLDQWIPVEQPH